MEDCVRIGVLMGGASREREVSFAGGRTVYDLLDRRLFAPVPLFLDASGRLIELDWPYLYKGTIRDFFPPADAIPPQSLPFQLYSEHLGPLSDDAWERMLRSVGQPLAWDQLPRRVDAVFLCLHGLGGEDGRIQGLLEHLGVPYTGTGILGAALGLDKAVQRPLLHALGYAVPNWTLLNVTDALKHPEAAWHYIEGTAGFPCVFKHPVQGSSIGVRVVKSPADALKALQQVSFRWEVATEAFAQLGPDEQFALLNEAVDLRTGVGLPAWEVSADPPVWIQSPQQLWERLLQAPGRLELVAPDAPSHILVEAFVEGDEFSVIVVEDADGHPMALPPTQIAKPGAVYDYRGKYLPGLARKLTPMPLPEAELEALCQQAEKLKRDLHMGVYARLDGIRRTDGQVFFNDPNTTSGMLPSSFFFHQAAELGLSPTEFLTFIVRSSLRQATARLGQTPGVQMVQHKLEERIFAASQQQNEALKVAVVFGGDSSERHISVESGRNVVQKLQSSGRYAVRPLFLVHNSRLPAHVLKDMLAQDATMTQLPYSLWELPVAMLLKDHADDIAERISRSGGHTTSSWLNQRRARMQQAAGGIMAQREFEPVWQPWQQLPQSVQFVFLALHGRPGEDGQVQQVLDSLRIPYNGSPADSAALTINKYDTNERLMRAGLLAPRHCLVDRATWQQQGTNALAGCVAELGLPLIAKPVDDGCSSAVQRIDSLEQLEAYVQALFRKESSVPEPLAITLKLKAGEEFPAKAQVLLEERVAANGCDRFLEVTVGFLSVPDGRGGWAVQVLEPSEALAAGAVLSLEEKFLAGEGQNITPARFSDDPKVQAAATATVKEQMAKAVAAVGAQGYGRIDAFVRVWAQREAEVVFIEVNSLPGLTPATCIYHQAALAGLSPLAFLEAILRHGLQRHGQPVPVA